MSLRRTWVPFDVVLTGAVAVEPKLERARDLKQALIDFVLTAEGELAQALEAYTATQAQQREHFDIAERNRVIDSFLNEGRVDGKTPLTLFLEQHPELTAGDRALVESWQRSFTGLFAVEQVLEAGFELMNWLTAKHYQVQPNDPATLTEMARFQPGDILLTRIAPAGEELWMFSGPCTFLGRLGKPKLAVAIGNFKRDYKNHLYSDAPELLAESWRSVARYHQDFLDFFGSDEITLPGYQLNRKLAEFQEYSTQKHLSAIGVDSSKSLADIAQETGMTTQEIQEAMVETGVNPEQVRELLDPGRSLKMVMPKVQLPAALKQAEQVTVLAHPHWGQVFLPTYTRFQALLTAAAEQDLTVAEPLVWRYLEDPDINTFVWQRLAQKYPAALESLLQKVLQRPSFQLDRDLDALLQEYHKPLEPDLPEIASVPLHLDQLFQEAIAEVSKSRPKGKGKKKTSTGFGGVKT